MTLDIEAFAEHVQAWQHPRRRLTCWDRLRVRRALARRYRDIGLPRPRHVFVDSPIAAAIVGGIAAGVRWLQRHPETHVALFGRPLDEAAYNVAIRDAVHDAIAAFDYPPDASRLIAAIETVTSGAALPLATFARARARPIESINTAPDVAARDGAIDQVLLDETLDRLLTRLREPVVHNEHTTLSWGDFAWGAVRAIVRHGLGTQQPSSFLGRVLAAWYAGQQTRDQRMYRLAVVCFHRHRWFALDYRFTRDIECALRRTYALHVHADFWIAADWPRVQHDARQRPHRIGAPAIYWRDGTGIPYLHGVQVTRAIMEGRFTFGDILHASNAEIRRTMIELYERDDRGRFLRDADAEVLHFDYDRLGHKQRLLRVDLPGDEPYVGVEVINSTPEPDGSHKRYILRVPPSTPTCRAGIAWTFGLAEHQYDPDAET